MTAGGVLSFIDRVKARSALLERLALRTQIRSRLRQGDAAQSVVTACRQVAVHLDRLRGSGEPIEVTFDTTNAPPSYGDFLNVVMVARFLLKSGCDVAFRIRDVGERRSDWADLTPAQQEAHLTDCLAIARAMLGDGAAVERVDTALAGDGSAPPSPLEGFEDPAYILAETIFHVLMDEREWPLPSGFLLTAQDFAVPAHLPTGPYLSWHVRRGVWDRGRDTTASGVLTDIQQLREAFPGQRFMLFSSPAGVEFAIDQLARSSGGAADVIPQPEAGFLSAAPYVLESDLYFQRRGGGLSQFAVYSAMPYLILNDHASYYYLRSGDRLVPWATVGQQYVIKRGVASLRIADLIER
jgi:hypothetical protein